METRERTVGRALLEIWEDQAAFNRLFRQPPTSPQELSEQIRSFVLYTESELHELLRTTQWKEHRRQSQLQNRPHMIDEAVDVFKYAISIFQILGMTPEELIAGYWAKTRVVRQRYQEEWAKDVAAPCVVVDIDNVLADYVTGLCDWIIGNPAWRRMVDMDVIYEVLSSRKWIGAEALGISDERWKRLKHDFRTSGGKRDLPVFPEVRGFLARVRQLGYQIVLLTSRPIDRYPNLYTDTLAWLVKHDLPFDFIWWSHDKAERILEQDLRPHVQFMVDDDLKYVMQFANLGIRTYWRVNPETLPTSAPHALVTPVTSLTQIPLTGEPTWPTTPTPSTDLTPRTSEIAPRPGLMKARTDSPSN